MYITVKINKKVTTSYQWCCPFFFLQNFIHCLNFFIMTKYHAHNQKTKIKLNMIVFIFEKKVNFFTKMRKSLWIEILSDKKCIGPRRKKEILKCFPSSWETECRIQISRIVQIFAFSETSRSTSTEFSLICKMEI